MDHSVNKHASANGITWHIEQFRPSTSTSESENIILIPSGEGDCQNLVGLASILCQEYNYSVITFDNPGFSRTTAPPEAYDIATPQLVASQIKQLLQELGINKTSAFGCSSGGLDVLALVALYPELIKCGIVHEVPFACPPFFLPWKELDDEVISATCKEFFAKHFIEDEEKWNDLGPEYHTRLSKNYVTWVRHIMGICEEIGRQLATPENLNKRPLFWTVGSQNQGVEQEEGIWQLDFEVAREAGLSVDKETLKCLHFPAVTVPQDTARWIDSCVKRASDS